jgi:Ni,Fe-hydrogenase III large subunit
VSVAPNAKPAASYPPEQLGAARESAPEGEVRLRVEPAEFVRGARMMRDAGARFATLFLAQTPERSLIGAFALHGELVLLRSPVAAGARVQSIGEWWPAACWPERELAELHDVEFEGMPLWRALTAPDADLIDRRVEGLDVFSIPYGPVRSGVFEAIQFHIETGGEDVPRVETRPFFKRRGMENRFTGLTADVAVHVAERVAGIASCAYAAAFSQAVESALGVTPPPRAQRWRAVHCELERMACHLDVIAKQAETTALYVGQARFQILKERVQRLRARLTGSRFGRGAIVPGGVRGEGMMSLDELLGELDEIERQLRRDRRMFLGTASMTDRLIGCGRLARELVEDYGAVGPLARGSGLSTDVRHERPYGNYKRLGLRVVSERDGDAMARVNVRFGELAESLRLLRQSIDHLRRRDGELRAVFPRGGEGTAVGWVEAPQGELLVWVELREGLLVNVHIASPSLRNWALFDHAFPNDVLTDFAFIEHSFGLTPAGADR